MSMPVWPDRNFWLTPLFGGFVGIGHSIFEIVRFVTVTLGAPVGVMMPGVAENMAPRTEVEGGVGEPVPASWGIDTGSSELAAWSGAGVKAGSLGGFPATGISRRWPDFRPAFSGIPLTVMMPVFETP